jgi:hypothetical protein
METPTTTNTNTAAIIKEKLDASLWVREAVKALLSRDLIDAENDALSLVQVQRLRLQTSTEDLNSYKGIIEQIEGDYAASYWLKGAVSFLGSCEPEFAFSEAVSIHHMLTCRELTKSAIA